ncbi:MAG: hypothetical protein KAS38_20060, partial [Anaerolineales bacterium]|nr:hypothetical protein [Anaerolineales bacterium]
MMGNPEKLIEQYLDRVRVYLPLDSEDTLAEIRTHLLEEAETIGQGTVTSGSIMMAIERFGEPTRVANEYAGTGEKTGPIPTAYVQPILRILAVLVGVSAAFLVGAFIVGQVFPDFFGTFSFFPWFIPLIVVINIIFAFMIVAGITMFDEKDPTERTALEGIFGIGTEAFKPKSRGSAAGDAIGGVIFVIILTLAAIQLMFTPLFAQLTGFLAVIFMIGAVKGTLFFFGGENNITLGIEALESGIWVFFSMFLINISWPIENAWTFVNGQWVLGNLAE